MKQSSKIEQAAQVSLRTATKYSNSLQQKKTDMTKPLKGQVTSQFPFFFLNNKYIVVKFLQNKVLF